ncbi:MAG: hypothetical protein ACXWPS_14570 [Ktedonobacteraceae bacterium]
MLNDIPRAIPGTKTAITETITLSMRIDRTWVLEIGKHVVIIFSAEETSMVHGYLLRHAAKFSTGDRQG